MNLWLVLLVFCGLMSIWLTIPRPFTTRSDGIVDAVFATIGSAMLAVAVGWVAM